MSQGLFSGNTVSNIGWLVSIRLIPRFFQITIISSGRKRTIKNKLSWITSQSIFYIINCKLFLECFYTWSLDNYSYSNGILFIFYYLFWFWRKYNTSGKLKTNLRKNYLFLIFLKKTIFSWQKKQTLQSGFLIIEFHLLPTLEASWNKKRWSKVSLFPFKWKTKMEIHNLVLLFSFCTKLESGNLLLLMCNNWKLTSVKCWFKISSILLLMVIVWP